MGNTERVDFKKTSVNARPACLLYVNVNCKWFFTFFAIGSHLKTRKCELAQISCHFLESELVLFLDFLQ